MVVCCGLGVDTVLQRNRSLMSFSVERKYTEAIMDIKAMYTGGGGAAPVPPATQIYIYSAHILHVLLPHLA